MEIFLLKSNYGYRYIIITFNKDEGDDNLEVKIYEIKNVNEDKKALSTITEAKKLKAQ